MSKQPPRGSIPPPTALDSLKNGLQVFSDDFIPLLVMGFAITAIGGACRSPVLFLEHGGVYASGLLTLFVASPFELGMSFVCLRAVRSGRVNFEHLIAVFGRYGSMIIASALMAVMIAAGTALFVIPGIALFCATRFVPFLLLEDELSGIDAVRESLKLSRNHAWQLLGICAVGFSGVVAVGVLARYASSFSTVGLVPVLVWWNLALASFYHSIVRPPAGWALEDQEELERRRANEELDERDEVEESK